MQMKMDKNILVQQLKNGSEEAFRQLVEIYRNRVFNTCYGFVNNQADADDLAQEVFIEVFHSIKYFKENSSVATWIYRIAVNKSLDHLRHSKRKKRWSELFKLSAPTNENIDRFLADNETPQQQMELKERQNILYKIIERLPENQRIAFTLHKMEDLSYQEIAETMQTSVAAVESLMHRAKTNLRNRLEKFYLDEKNLTSSESSQNQKRQN
jgi:RNA polymerase sigma-70 factor (family 1)